MRFAMVGVVGLGVDVSTLYAMLAVSLDYVSGRVVSFGAAVTCTWYLNRRFTFSELASPNAFTEWAKFVTTNLGGALINFAVYLAIVSLGPAILGLAALAVAAGSLSGMIFNYTASRTLVFRGRAPGVQRPIRATEATRPGADP